MKLVMKSGLRLHLYVDDLQISRFCAPTATQASLDQVAACISVLWSWKPRSNQLQLNADKTESLWCVSSNSFLAAHWPYALITSYRQSTFAIWASTSTWRPTYREPCPAASPLYVRLRAYGVLSVNQFCCRWYRHWSCLDLIMEAPCCLASQDSSWTVCTQCSTLHRDWSTAAASTTALLHCSRNSTGCKSPSESSFNWPFSCSSAATRQHLADDLQWAADDDSRMRLRSAASNKLILHQSRLSTAGDRTFGIAAPLEQSANKTHLSKDNASF